MAIPYRIGTVSKLTGITIDTLRAWERRYSAVVPKRGDSRRGYDQTDVARLILLRRAVDMGHAISTIAALSDQELRSLVEDGSASGSLSILIQSLLTALENFDYAALNEQLGRMAAVLPPSEIVDQIVLPVMREVGERWHRDQLTIAQEHMMSGLVHQVLGTLMGLYRPAPGAPKLIFATPEGEMHTIGILAAAMLAAGAGLSPIYLGPSLPPKEIVNAARRSGAKAVVLQIAGPSVPAADQVRRILDSLPAGVELWIGSNPGGAYEGALALHDFPALNENYRRLMAAA
jgi:MerR family transcriptional regulator, light-induced transcriptional regulator